MYNYSLRKTWTSNDLAEDWRRNFSPKRDPQGFHPVHRMGSERDIFLKDAQLYVDALQNPVFFLLKSKEFKGIEGKILEI